MNGQLRIEEMFAYVVLDDDNTEGVPAFQMGDMMMPLMGADVARARTYRPLAQKIARELGKKVTLVKFTNREEIEVIE